MTDQELIMYSTDLVRLWVGPNDDDTGLKLSRAEAAIICSNIGYILEIDPQEIAEKLANRYKLEYGID